MATFSCKPTVVSRSADEIYQKFSNLEGLQSVLDNMPAAEKEKIGEVTMTTDSIIIKTAQVGDITLKITERSPERIKLQALNSPAPMALVMHIKPEGADKSEVSVDLDVDIPPFLKPMVGGAMQKAVDQFGGLIQKLV